MNFYLFNSIYIYILLNKYKFIYYNILSNNNVYIKKCIIYIFIYRSILNKYVYIIFIYISTYRKFILSIDNILKFRKNSQSAGFEPARAEPNRFLVYRLNRSATTAFFFNIYFNLYIINYILYNLLNILKHIKYNYFNLYLC